MVQTLVALIYFKSDSDFFLHLDLPFLLYFTTLLVYSDHTGTMAKESSIAPRYLTGDKAGLQEFLAKFDVSIRF